MTTTATNTAPNGLPTRIQEMIQHIELDYPDWKSVPFQFGQAKMTMTRSTRNYNAFPNLRLVIIKITIEANGKSIEFHVGMSNKKDGVYKEMYVTYDAEQHVQHTSRESVISSDVKADFDAFDEMLGHFLANMDKNAIVGAVSFQKQLEKKKQKEKERKEELEDAEGSDSINSEDEIGEPVSDDSEDANVEEEEMDEESDESSDDSSSEESSASSSDSEDERRHRKRSKHHHGRRHGKKNKSDKLKKELKKMRRDLDDLMEENRRLRKKMKK